ncbi:MAG TPA: MarR family transcriptional regulator [Galbitalea sp.]|jgi:DNA-binding MarR family transcriptional regulator|nr:MarR family transcriptional regulator [Galbitalea sp.]
MEPLDEPAPHPSLLGPADIDLPSTTAITIDIAQLLAARAGSPVTLDLSDFERLAPLRDDPRIEPVLGLISRSIAGAVRFIELPHLRVLVLLSQRESISVAELATLMKLRPRGTFALLDSMESAGWIAGDPQARGVGETIRISPQGRNVVESMTDQRQREIDEILGRISEADRVELTRAFNLFAAAAGEAPVHKPKQGISP